MSWELNDPGAVGQSPVSHGWTNSKAPMSTRVEYFTEAKNLFFGTGTDVLMVKDCLSSDI